MNAKIFVSYRRNDNRWAARKIYDDLHNKYKDSGILFKDHCIEGGENFEDRLLIELSSCNVFIAVVGELWISEIEKRKDEVDYVVKELVYALQAGKKIIPVLLENTPMPNEHELPNVIKKM